MVRPLEFYTLCCDVCKTEYQRYTPEAAESVYRHAWLDGWYIDYEKQEAECPNCKDEKKEVCAHKIAYGEYCIKHKKEKEDASN